jgi:hypothetical protein
MNQKEIQIKISQVASSLSRECMFKECVFPDHSSCSKKVIKAHSIQKNKILNHIADNGKVVTANSQKILFTYEFEKIGINSASTFFGFCNYHDAKIFSEIENKEYEGRIEQNFLHAYRACALEYVRSKISLCIYEKLVERYDINPYEKMAPKKLNGELRAKKDYYSILEQFSNELTKPKDERNFNIISSKIFQLPYESLLAVNESFPLEYDFQENLINDLADTSKRPAPIFITIFPFDGKTFILFSWLSEDLKTYQSIISKLETFTTSRKEIFFSNLIICHGNNFFISPTKYSQMPNKLRRLLGSKYRNILMTEFKPNYISRGGINLFRAFKK